MNYEKNNRPFLHHLPSSEFFPLRMKIGLIVVKDLWQDQSIFTIHVGNVEVVEQGNKQKFVLILQV